MRSRNCLRRARRWIAALRKDVAFIAATLVAPLAAAPAAAQDGAIWRDDKGRQMVLDFAGGGSPPPAPRTWTAQGMADLFNRLCIAGNGAAEVAKSEAFADGIKSIGLKGKSTDLPHYFEYSGKVGGTKPVRAEVSGRTRVVPDKNAMHLYIAF